MRNNAVNNAVNNTVNKKKQKETTMTIKSLSKKGLIDYLAKRQKYYLFSDLKAMTKNDLLLIAKSLGA